MHLDTESGNVFLFELASQVTLDKSGLADTAISDEDQLEFGNLFLLGLLHHLCNNKVSQRRFVAYFSEIYFKVVLFI